MRKRLRLPHFDYSAPGAYFVTIATQDRQALLGSVDARAQIALSDAGKMIEAWWEGLPQKFAAVTPDAHVTMPDHLHGIILLDVAEIGVAHQKVSVPEVIQWFKAMSTNEYIRRVASDGWRRFERRLWQRSFYDHVIRSESSLLEIRGYIEHNPGALFEAMPGRTHGSAPTHER